jgi:hypothetical protein
LYSSRVTDMLLTPSIFLFTAAFGLIGLACITPPLIPTHHFCYRINVHSSAQTHSIYFPARPKGGLLHIRFQ